MYISEFQQQNDIADVYYWWNKAYDFICILSDVKSDAEEVS